MTPLQQWDQIRVKRAITGTNQLVNLPWSAICLGPLAYYCYRSMDHSWLYAFLFISFIPLGLPTTVFDRIQLSASTGFYNRLGIRTVRKYTQDGDLINQWLQAKFPGYSPANQATLQQHVSRSYINEKFHVGCFSFFLLSSLYALHQGNGVWVAGILISNLIYNLYPILLQQYNRIRLTRLINRRSLRERD